MDFSLDYLAHAIVNGRHGIINVLISIGVDVSADADEETVFRLVLERIGDESIEKEIKKILREKPYHGHCIHCIEAIQILYDKGREIRKSLKAKKDALNE